MTTTLLLLTVGVDAITPLEPHTDRHQVRNEVGDDQTVGVVTISFPDLPSPNRHQVSEDVVGDATKGVDVGVEELRRDAGDGDDYDLSQPTNLGQSLKRPGETRQV